MKKLNKDQCKWVDLFFGLTQRDMPIGISVKTLKNHIKGKSDFCYHDIYLSVKMNYENIMNKQKIDFMGNQFSYMLQEALYDEQYEVCKNLSKYFVEINMQIESLNNYYLDYLVNKNLHVK